MAHHSPKISQAKYSNVICDIIYQLFVVFYSGSVVTHANYVAYFAAIAQVSQCNSAEEPLRKEIQAILSVPSFSLVILRAYTHGSVTFNFQH
jgi:hypothetical protein